MRAVLEGPYQWVLCGPGEDEAVWLPVHEYDARDHGDIIDTAEGFGAYLTLPGYRSLPGYLDRTWPDEIHATIGDAARSLLEEYYYDDPDDELTKEARADRDWLISLAEI